MPMVTFESNWCWARTFPAHHPRASSSLASSTLTCLTVARFASTRSKRTGNRTWASSTSSSRSSASWSCPTPSQRSTKRRANCCWNTTRTTFKGPRWWRRFTPRRLTNRQQHQQRATINRPAAAAALRKDRRHRRKRRRIGQFWRTRRKRWRAKIKSERSNDYDFLFVFLYRNNQRWSPPSFSNLIVSFFKKEIGFLSSSAAAKEVCEWAPFWMK